MATASKYEQIADEVIRGVGGAKNVQSVTHCATRLRFQLHDRTLADKDAVEATRGVITVVESGGQFQVVIGNTVSSVYEALTSNYAVASSGAVSGGFMAKAIDLITSIFTPFLWALAGTGLLKALLAVWVAVDATATASSTYAILFTAGDALFQFLPMLLAVTSAKKFNANVYTAIAIASALVYSSTIAVIPNAEGVSVTLQGYASGGQQLTFLGIPVIMVSYLSAVIPTILAVYAQSKLERFVDKVLPAAIRNFVTPLVAVAVIVPVTFLVIGPVSDWVGDGLASAISWAWDLSPAVGGALVGAFWQVFVIFGVHWGFVPLLIQEVTVNGYSYLFGPIFAAVLAQAGAAGAVFLRSRNAELKKVAGPATLSALIAGITEPAIYGVTLRLKKPFIYACIGGAVGGAIAAIGRTGTPFVIPGGITLSAGVGIGNYALLLIGTGVAIAIAFVLTLVLGFKDIPTKEAAAAEGVVASEAAAVNAPVAGQVVPLEAVPDKVFSSGAMGSGLAIIPSEGRAYAPVSGTLLTVMPHAFGIRGDDGLEVLVHIGIDTVQLNGKHFSPKVAQGQRVAAGDLLAEFDAVGIMAAGFNPITVMIITNPGGYAAVVPVATGDARVNEPALDLVG